MNEEFEALVLAVISEIPCGQVASYGQIAELAGYPRHGRHVGKACSHSEFYGDYPCHRVVNSQGRTAPGLSLIHISNRCERSYRGCFPVPPESCRCRCQSA